MALNPDDIATVSRLLDEALALSPSEREAWLAALPPEHLRHAGALRDMLTKEVQLDADHRLEAMPKLAPDEAVAHAGDRIGPYRLLHEIGRGGMGSVWLAERADGAYKRQVALKLPRLAWGTGLAERMAREREIGMLLEHPNIARLYDAGLDERGRPFLALEYVDGQPIDAWCEAQGLSVRDRLRLFVQVARAVAYAHGRLVVHRDLKPSNVLVTSDGQTRLLDFGIAKLLLEAAPGEPGLTQEQGRVLTPHYASPEQVTGEAITVQSDVYSLGVLLYELLTGTLPIAPKRGTLGAVEEAILEGDAPLASSRVKDPTTARALRGEVDAILGKAMQREPARRYSTADALVHDIERHLSGETVAARPDSVSYRLRKAVRRHWVGVGATAAILIAVMAGGATALVQSQRATHQAERARLATEFVTEMFRANARAVAPADSGGGPDRPNILDQTAGLIQTRFEGQPDIQAQLYGAVGQVYADMGAGSQAVAFANRQLTLLRATNATNAEMTRAVLLMARALDAQDLDAEAGEQAKLAVRLARSDDGVRAEANALLARILANNGEFEASREALLKAKQILQSGPVHPSIAWADVFTVQAMTTEDVAENLRLRQRSLVHALEVQGPASPYAAMVRSHIANILAWEGRGTEARALLEESSRAVKGTGGAAEISAAWRAAQTWSILYKSRQASFAEASAAIEDRRAFAAGSASVPPVIRAKIDFYAGECRMAWGDLNGAATLLVPSARVLKAETNYLLLKVEVVAAEAELASQQGRHEDADLLLRESHTLAVKAAGIGTSHLDYLVNVALNLGKMGQFDAAAALISEAKQTARGLRGQDTELLASLAEASARVSLDRGDAEAAFQAVQDADQIRAGKSTNRSEQQVLRGEILCALGQAAGGLPILQHALQSMGSRLSPSDPALARARAAAGLCAMALGQRAIAADCAAQARAAFTAQPDVSPYFKDPLARLEAKLRSARV